jgi:hypothetical protein
VSDTSDIFTAPIIDILLLLFIGVYFKYFSKYSSEPNTYFPSNSLSYFQFKVF